MSKRSLSVAFGAFAVSMLVAGVAFADCPGHSTESAQSVAPSTIVQANPPALPMTPAPETKTGG